MPHEREAPATVTDVVIVGAGPVGLFQVFELGLLGLRAHVIDSLREPGGQCIELYPDKPIYDIPAVPVCTGRELIERLLQQIRPFEAQLHLQQEVTQVERRPDGRFLVATNRGARFLAGAIVIAGGVGSFQPRRISVPNVARHEGQHIHYRVVDAARFAGRDLIVLGGGDSALDWSIAFAATARSVVLVHRREVFRAAPASVARALALRDEHQLDIVTGIVDAVVEEGEEFRGLAIRGADGVVRRIAADHALAFWGLHPKLGPIAEWGLTRHGKSLAVDAARFQTSTPGIYAVGDINDYPGKKKLILSGFHEAALAAFAIREHLQPGTKVPLQYTTTSPQLLRRLGVAGVEPAREQGARTDMSAVAAG